MKKSKLIIVADRGFFDYQNKAFSIGGVQTYVLDLANLANALNYQVEIWIRDNCEYNTTLKNITLIGINTVSFQKVFNLAAKTLDAPTDRIIIDTDQLDIVSTDSRAIQIQHGIAFDGDFSKLPAPFCKIDLLVRLERIARAWVNTNRVFHTPTTVCVDYNYYNWVRTLGCLANKANVFVIPNYASSAISQAEFEEKIARNNNHLKILFARRFVEHRGTIVFIEAVQKLLQEFPNTDFTFAGSGPLKHLIEETFKNEPRVKITRYAPEKSVEFHKQFDIAIVPTLASEGTSLSILEAMAAGCFPIATHVGGLTNILIDGFNGILCSPDSNSIYNALKDAISMPREKFISIQRRAYESAINGFSKEIWEKRWTNILEGR